MKGNKCVIWLVMVLFMFSCESERKEKFTNNPEEVINQLSTNETLVIKKKIGGYSVELIRLMPDIIVSKELKNGLIQKDDVRDRMNLLKEKRAFFMKINGVGNNAISNRKDYSQIVDYFNFQIADDFFMKSEAGKIKCTQALFSNTQGIKPGIEIMVEFDKPKEGQYTVEYHDKVFGMGIVKFKIDEKEDNLIKLKY